MIRSNICDEYIHNKGTITVPNTGTTATSNNGNKKSDI